MSRVDLPFLLFGLLIKCPFGRELDGCPLLSLRTLECLEDKFVLAEQLPEDETHQLLTVHQVCYRARLAKHLHSASVDRQTNSPPRRSVTKHGGGLIQVSANW